MVREPNPDRKHRTFGRILDDLDAKPEPERWLDAARTLSERLLISEDTMYYLADMLTECIIFAASSTDPQLVRARNEMVDIERAHGLREDEGWTIGEATEEWRRLNDDWDRRADEIVNARLRDAGHADIAALREKSRDEFEGLAAKGRTDLWGEDDDGLAP
jgi:hypothetical protein